MHVEYAQLPPAAESADRIFVTENAVIVLDGASAFAPVPVSAATYANVLGGEIAAILTADPQIDLRHCLAEAIRTTASRLNLTAGPSPSSTVAILRTTALSVDVLVLGDSPVIVGTEPPTRITDARLRALNLPESRAYRRRLSEGSGYDDEHRQLLVKLQQRQLTVRNRPDGYWIAERDHHAADYAEIRSFPRHSVNWALLMSDGAALHANVAHAVRIADADGNELLNILARWRHWESTADPNGQQLPRAKRHDDMAIAVIRL